MLYNIYVDNNNPGTSDYEQKELIGRIFNSKFRSSEGKTMYGRYKIADKKANEPGPGQYRVFSEFGIYESKYAKTEPNEPPPKKERVEIPMEALKPKPKKAKKPKPEKIEETKEENNIEEPKAEEEPKHEEYKPEEEVKVEDSRPEIKAEEPKPEDNKPLEEPKPEEAKAEEVKKEEEVKVDEPKPEEAKPEEEKKEEVPVTQANIETTTPAQ